MRIPTLLLAIALLGLLPAAAQAQDVLVRYKPGTDAGERADARRGADVRRAEGLPLARTELVVPGAGVTAAEAIAALERDDDVLYAERDAVRRAYERVPNDEFFGLEWGLRNTGQAIPPGSGGPPGTPGADIRATEAWDVTTGNSSVLVAVADTGVDLDHPDLLPNLFRNAREASGVTGVDDDGNGEVDDVRGWDYANGDAIPEDGDGHGSHVTGTVGARGDNGTGVTGVAWQVTLLPIQVLDAEGTGTVSTAIKAYGYAARTGARVINLSLGGDSFSRTERDAIAAIPNVLVVAASGNEAKDLDAPRTGSYPCEYDLPNVLCVAATDQNDNLASFSNYGATSVDLAAPGVNIASTFKTGQYVYSDGTSMSAPFVSGAAALRLAQRPATTAADLRSEILTSAERLPSLAGRVTTGARLDTSALVGYTPPPPPPEPTPQPTPTPTPTPAPQPTPTPTPTPTPVLADRTPPFLSAISLTPRRDLRAALRRGIRARLRCSEPCTVRIDVLRGRTRIARRTVRTAAAGGSAATVLRTTAARARRLRALRRVTLTVRFRAVDAQGNARTVSRRLTLRR